MWGSHVYTPNTHPSLLGAGFFMGRQMAAIPTTVAINCPRCDEPIDCTLEAEEHADERGYITLECVVPDLRARLSAHYEVAH